MKKNIFCLCIILIFSNCIESFDFFYPKPTPTKIIIQTAKSKVSANRETISAVSEIQQYCNKINSSQKDFFMYYDKTNKVVKLMRVVSNDDTIVKYTGTHEPINGEVITKQRWINGYFSGYQYIAGHYESYDEPASIPEYFTLHTTVDNLTDGDVVVGVKMFLNQDDTVIASGYINPEGWGLQNDNPGILLPSYQVKKFDSYITNKWGDKVNKITYSCTILQFISDINALSKEKFIKALKKMINSQPTPEPTLESLPELP